MVENQQPSPMRTCRVCGVEKPISSYGTTKSAGNGELYHRHECRQCTYKRQEEWREKNREKLRSDGARRMKEWRESMTPERFEKYKEESRLRAKRRLDRMRDQVYAAYGGYICKCCGETEPKFLSIDHVNNDGYKLRKNGEHGSGALIYEWAVREFKKAGKWPDNLQVLCMNCQHGKARNGGVCPHQEGSTTRRKP